MCVHSVWTHSQLSELYLKGKPAHGPLGCQKQLLHKHIIQYLSHQLLDASSWQEHSPSSRVWGFVHQLEADDIRCWWGDFSEAGIKATVKCFQLQNVS